MPEYRYSSKVLMKCEKNEQNGQIQEEIIW